MATDSGSSSSEEELSSSSPLNESSSGKPQSLASLAKPWADYAAHQALLYQRTIDDSLESAIQASKSRLSQIRSTSHPHLQKTIVISPHLFFFCYSLMLERYWIVTMHVELKWICRHFGWVMLVLYRLISFRFDSRNNRTLDPLCWTKIKALLKSLEAIVDFVQ